jgi:hypothetical protein
MHKCPLCLFEIPYGAWVCGHCGAIREEVPDALGVVKAIGIALAVWGIFVAAAFVLTDIIGILIIGGGFFAVFVFTRVKDSASHRSVWRMP